MEPRVAVVTGANQGLGLALVRRLAATPGRIVYLTGRDAVRVEAAKTRLSAEGCAVEGAVMDVTDGDSVARCAAEIASRHGGVDAVISNAAARITPDAAASDQVEAFVAVNNLGGTRVMRVFAPLLRAEGRLVVVASGFGSLRRLPLHLHPLLDGPALGLAEIDEVMRDYARAVREGVAAAQGWPEWINIPSKVAHVAAMRVLARELAHDPRGVLVSAACPGLVDTAASRPWFDDMSEAQSPDAAAVDVAWLAEARRGQAPYGELVRFRQVVPWR